MLKNNLMLPAIILCLICLITTGLVALTYTMTLDARNEQAVIAANANRRLLCPDAATFDVITLTADQQKTGLVEAYTAKDAGGRALAWLFVAQAKGYAGQVPVTLAINTDGQITGLKILNNNETPGLGKKVADLSFYGQFIGKTAGPEFAVKNATASQQLIDAVTGATISSRAATKAINAAADFYRQNIKEVK
jgi:electron transport complex protein RnfG